MIYKTFQVKTQEDYDELSKNDKNSLIIQYNKWLQGCPVKYNHFNATEKAWDNNKLENNEPYPHRVQLIKLLVLLYEPVEEDRLRKYSVD